MLCGPLYARVSSFLHVQFRADNCALVLQGFELYLFERVVSLAMEYSFSREPPKFIDIVTLLLAYTVGRDTGHHLLTGSCGTQRARSPQATAVLSCTFKIQDAAVRNIVTRNYLELFFHSTWDFLCGTLDLCCRPYFGSGAFVGPCETWQSPGPHRLLSALSLTSLGTRRNPAWASQLCCNNSAIQDPR